MWLVCNLRTRDRFEKKPRNPVYDVINPFQLWKGILSPIFNYWPILQVNHVNLVSFFITFFIYILFTFCLRNKHMSLLILVFRFLSSFILILLHCSSVLLSFLFWFFFFLLNKKTHFACVVIMSVKQLAYILTLHSEFLKYKICILSIQFS